MCNLCRKSSYCAYQKQRCTVPVWNHVHMVPIKCGVACMRIGMYVEWKIEATTCETVVSLSSRTS